MSKKPEVKAPSLPTITEKAVDAVVIPRRKLTSCHVNDSEATTVEAYGERGAGGANHNYKIAVRGTEILHLTFTSLQGDIRLDAVTDEVLLAILIDRLEGFQSGKFPHRCNAEALQSLQYAQEQLKIRTRERLRRGVEGTLNK